jgi:LacI family transcriptional regulator
MRWLSGSSSGPVSQDPSRRVRLSDVALLARTSTKTASRVINNDPRVAAATRSRVEQAVVSLGYRPDPLARSLRRGTDDVIGVIVDEVGDPFFASVIGEIERMTLEQGMTVVIASTRRLPQRENVVITGLLERRVAGLILASTSENHAHLVSTPCPVVFIDRAPVGLVADAVLVDDRAGARMAVDHMMARGHRRIAYVGDRFAIDTARSRQAGYAAALEAASIPARDDYVVLLDLSLPDGSGRVTELLSVPDPPTAIFSANARSTFRILTSLREAGRTDIALVSFGDFATAEVLTPAITVIDHSPELLGRAAAARLLRRMGGEQLQPDTLVVPLHLVERGSGELPPLPPARTAPQRKDQEQT